MGANLGSGQPAPREGYVPVDRAGLFYRDAGQGQPVIVLHGGPDFDHTYLLPDMDRLAAAYRLIYYDQRGRGKSAANVQPEDVTIQSEIEDLEAVRKYFRFATAAVLGHSWGGLLALEYALRYPDRVSHLILLNSAPVSHADLMLLREDRRRTAAADLEQMAALAATAAYRQGDPDTVAAYYRIHFRTTLKRPAHLDRVIRSLRAGSTSEGILKARAIEQRLYEQTWWLPDYNLLAKLEELSIPALILHGDHDLIPVECAQHIAQAIPEARFVVLSDCGHFSYLQCPDAVRREIGDFFSNM